MWSQEQELRERGVWPVAGVDEAGRGCLCGPVVAAAFIASDLSSPPAVSDSKSLTARQREISYSILLDSALDYAVGIASAEEVENLNVVGATRLAMLRAVRALRRSPELVLVDGLRMDLPGFSTNNIVRGDALVGSIAAASVIAKVTRDAIMRSLHKHHPRYGWDSNKGYPTRRHLQALRRLGPTPFHRRTFKGVRQQKLVL